MLTMDPVVQVNVSVDLATTVQSVFDVGAIVGPSNILNTTNRYKAYSSLADMVTDGFADTMPEYVAAQKYFGVSPAPASVVIVHYDTDPDAEMYSNEQTYAVGGYCKHTDSDTITRIYQCSTAISTAEDWNSEHWTVVTPTTDTPAIALADAVEKGAEFYGVYYCHKASETTSATKTNLVAINGWLNSRNFGTLFAGVVGSASEITVADGILDTFAAAGAKRFVGVACTSDEKDAAGVMGLAMGMARTHTNSAFALAYKSVASMTVNNFTQSEVETVNGKNASVYVRRTKDRASLEMGSTSSGMRYDEVLYLDMIAADLQVACFNLIANSDVKLPQNDTTTALFKSVIARVLESYYTRGVLSTAEWRGIPKATVKTGDVIEHGYYMWADRFDNQTTEDRAAHKSMPFVILLCLSGAVESIVLNLFVQR